jgi:hypothetical protein
LQRRWGKLNLMQKLRSMQSSDSFPDSGFPSFKNLGKPLAKKLVNSLVRFILQGFAETRCKKLQSRQ